MDSNINTGQYRVSNDPPKPGYGPAEEDLGTSTRETAPDPVTSVKRPPRFWRAIRDFLGGEVILKEWVAGNIYYILFLAILALLYIANTSYTIQKYGKIEKTQKEIQELRIRLSNLQKDLIRLESHSEITRKAAVLGLQEITTPNFKIHYPGDSIPRKNIENNESE